MAIRFSKPTTTIDDLTRTLRFDRVAGPEATEVRTTHLPAEWYPQSGVQLTWPHADTDWAPILPQVTGCYLRMAYEIARRERLIIITPHVSEVKALLDEKLPSAVAANISLHEAPTNDTWARDHGFITLTADNGAATLLDFRFNGWGNKFPADLDNAINSSLYRHGVLGGTYVDHNDFVLEGGSIEADGNGTVLTTACCLLAPHRNQPLTRDDISRKLKELLHAEQVLWIDYGHLEGDDTDGHIDTLVRTAPNNTLLYIGCDDKRDEHYDDLYCMEEQLRTLRNAQGEPYRLLRLPMVDAMYDDGERLPATYANFVIVNGAVIYPTYRQPENDAKAAKVIAQAFPGYDLIGIDSCTVVRQHGSLHCCTMQLHGSLHGEHQRA